MKSFFSLTLQDSMSPLMGHISFFHDHVMLVMLMILSTVIYVYVMVVVFPCYGRFFKNSELLEGLWTLLPCFVLVALAAPSLMTLYLSDEVSKPAITLKVVGHQWYWSYEYDFASLTMMTDCYMTPTHSLGEGALRLLETDNSVFLPFRKEVRLIITSADVIHSWSIPSMGVKMDAIPGRLNQVQVYPSRPGVIYGQCSEICGTLHSFMPIKIEVVKFSS